MLQLFLSYLDLNMFQKWNNNNNFSLSTLPRSDPFRSFVDYCLLKIPQDRPSSGELLRVSGLPLWSYKLWPHFLSQSVHEPRGWVIPTHPQIPKTQEYTQCFLYPGFRHQAENCFLFFASKKSRESILGYFVQLLIIGQKTEDRGEKDRWEGHATTSKPELMCFMICTFTTGLPIASFNTVLGHFIST